MKLDDEDDAVEKDETQRSEKNNVDEREAIDPQPTTSTTSEELRQRNDNDSQKTIDEKNPILVCDREGVSFDDTTYHCPFMLSMDFDSLDPSLAMGFLCVCEEDYVDLVERLTVSVVSASSPPLFDILENRPKSS